ncbi:MAG: glycosyltransferase [Candidatus Omnitrophica bacterium]|nr:glycosyltransferase [Candidatus Omnitrophota bacterium]
MFSLVFPVYNEASRLEQNIKRTIKVLNKLKIKYEIIIAEDGSTDNTYQISLSLAKKYKNLRVLHSSKRLGRGLALKKAFSIAKYGIVGYMDIDLSASLQNLKDLIEYARKFDIVTGSRYLKNRGVERKLKRKIISLVYNSIVRIVFNSRIKDHQCGFKAFKKKVITKLNKMAESNHWFWDTEILIFAQRNKYKVKEFPISWRESEETKVNILNDIVKMGFSILKLRFKLW